MILVLFSISKIQDGRHIVLSMLSDILKLRKYDVGLTISLLSLKLCIPIFVGQTHGI